jgi:hypothetical protein
MSESSGEKDLSCLVNRRPGAKAPFIAGLFRRAKALRFHPKADDSFCG